MGNPSHLQRLRGALQARYEHWRALTEAEGEAIETGRWPQVEKLQKTKAQLQVLIGDTTRELRAEYDRSGLQANQLEAEFQPVIEHLLDLERRNARSLAAYRQQARMQWEKLRTLERTLRQVHQTYAPTPPAFWQSYS